MNKKVGIVTFHRAHNYGAVLQAYALQKVIEECNCIVGFIDYQHEYFKHGYNIYPSLKTIKSTRKLLSYFKKWLELFLDYKHKRLRHSHFQNFINNHLNIFPEENLELELVVLGSDQIWNYKYLNGFDKNYFGDINGVISKKTISYAASMGCSKIHSSFLDNFIYNISKIDKIGVRENSLKKYIEKHTKTSVEVNLDPTLLLTANDWNKLPLPERVKDKYILVYEVHNHPETSATAEKIGKLLDCKIVNLTSKADWRLSPNSFTTASPLDFLSLFKHAEFVVTTSFHGTVFSILFKRNFFTMKFGSDIDIRSSELLNLLLLSNRQINTNNETIIKSSHV
jgi:hypothetical protein